MNFNTPEFTTKCPLCLGPLKESCIVDTIWVCKNHPEPFYFRHEWSGLAIVMEDGSDGTTTFDRSNFVITKVTGANSAWLYCDQDTTHYFGSGKVIQFSPITSFDALRELMTKLEQSELFV